MAGQGTVNPLGTPMPSLIRLLVVLVILGGLGFAGMIALTIMVDPGEKDITIKIPTRELVAPASEIDLGNLPAPVNVAPKDESSEPPPAVDTSDPEASASGVKTVTPGGAE
jgi:hypothetical protein